MSCVAPGQMGFAAGYTARYWEPSDTGPKGLNMGFGHCVLPVFDAVLSGNREFDRTYCQIRHFFSVQREIWPLQGSQACRARAWRPFPPRCSADPGPMGANMLHHWDRGPGRCCARPFVSWAWTYLGVAYQGPYSPPLLSPFGPIGGLKTLPSGSLSS